MGSKGDPFFVSGWGNFGPAAGFVLPSFAVASAVLVGYGVLRPCCQGFKIGPLFADTFDIADCLFRALTHHAASQPVFIDIPNIHPALSVLIQRFRLQPVFTYVRMYWGNMPNLDINRIFGVTTLELG